MKPLLLDLFCGAGGCSVGYSRAGFDVVGVDLHPQKRYPFDFLQMDAIEVLQWLISGDALRFGDRYIYLSDIAAIAASPECQAHSIMTKGRWQDRLEEHINLIPETRQLILQFGVPYVIENVPGASKELNNPLMLCGTMFGLQTKLGSQLRRHRLFETSPAIWFPPGPCQHNKASVIGVYGGGQNPNRKRIPATGVYGHTGGGSNRDGILGFSIQDRRDAMRIDWMTGKELSQAIPPAYTEFIGKHLLASIIKPAINQE